ncbi:MAG: TRAP transporter large permease, partial [Flavobacteriaceae bacterium]|nr:TRAP transporter large permease [Flavobacteriaceae bacterium]
AYIAFVAYKKGFAKGVKTPMMEIWTYFRKAFFSLLLLIIVVGGIVAGIFTATEASAIAVLYAAVLALIYGDIGTKDFPNILLMSAKTTAVVMFLICTSMAMSWLFSFESIPELISSFLLDQFSNKFVILLIINIILLIVGTFMDITPAVLIFTPIFLPVMVSLGMHPVHFGIMMVLNLCVGLCTPPVGTVLFVGSGVAKVSVTEVIKPLLPFLVVMILVLLLVSYIPEITLFLPNLFNL